MCAGDIVISRASITGMSKMEHKAKFLQCGGLEEFAIPLFDEVKW
jgi:hypothetical protein